MPERNDSAEPRSNLESILIRVLAVLVLPGTFLVCELWLGWIALTRNEVIVLSILLTLLAVVIERQMELIRRSHHGAEDLERKHGQYQKQLDRWLANVRDHVLTQDRATRMLQHYAHVIDRSAGESRQKNIEVLFAQRLIKDAEDSMQLLSNEHRYQMEVRSPAQQYSRRWIEVLDSLMGANGEFKTITNAVVWSPEYLGFRHGVSSYLNNQIQTATQNRFVVKRLFVVPNEEALEHDPQLAQRLLETLGRYHNQTSGHASFMKCRVLLLDENDYEDHLTREPTRDIGSLVGPGWSGNFGVWANNAATTVNLVRYNRDRATAMGWSIEAICFLSNESVAKLCSDFFDDRWADGVSIPLADYLPQLERIALKLRVVQEKEVAGLLTPAPTTDESTAARAQDASRSKPGETVPSSVGGGA